MQIQRTHADPGDSHGDVQNDTRRSSLLFPCVCTGNSISHDTSKPRDIIAVCISLQMEKYSKHLETLVGERTADLIHEKQKTDRLLYSECCGWAGTSRRRVGGVARWAREGICEDARGDQGKPRRSAGLVELGVGRRKDACILIHHPLFYLAHDSFSLHVNLNEVDSKCTHTHRHHTHTPRTHHTHTPLCYVQACCPCRSRRT